MQGLPAERAVVGRVAMAKVVGSETTARAGAARVAARTAAAWAAARLMAVEEAVRVGEAVAAKEMARAAVARAAARATAARAAAARAAAVKAAAEWVAVVRAAVVRAATETEAAATVAVATAVRTRTATTVTTTAREAAANGTTVMALGRVVVAIEGAVTVAAAKVAAERAVTVREVQLGLVGESWILEPSKNERDGGLPCPNVEAGGSHGVRRAPASSRGGMATRQGRHKRGSPRNPRSRESEARKLRIEVEGSFWGTECRADSAKSIPGSAVCPVDARWSLPPIAHT